MNHYYSEIYNFSALDFIKILVFGLKPQISLDPRPLFLGAEKLLLDKIIQLIYLNSKNLLRVLKVPLRGRTGKPVKLRYGPAAVIGDETRETPLVCY
jgi:hypothetical protein